MTRVAQLAVEAVGSLRVPAPVVAVGPDPAGNRWSALAVGLPVWLWVDGVGDVSQTVSVDGVEIGLSAGVGVVEFDLGDGTVVRCVSMTRRPVRGDPMVGSPDCGHVYQRPGVYVITARAGWVVRWQALGYAGQAGLASTGSYRLEVREFSTVVVG